MTETFNDINLWVKLNDITFNIKKIIIYDHSIPNSNYIVINSREIKILAETSNSNYRALGNWCEPIMESGYVTNYKVDINSNGFFIGGIFPIDYDFDQYKINVTFSADYVSGDIHLFKLQQLRKEKLKKLNEICQDS